MSDTIDRFVEQRAKARDEMGGESRVRRLEETGQKNARERIDLLLDESSFSEIGRFASSAPPDERLSMPGDGRIAGFGTVDGRSIGVIADDATIKGATSTEINIRKIDHVYRQALRACHPLVYFGEARGSRIPETLGSEGMPEVAGEGVEWGRRGREIPLATIITGPSFGGSSFIAAMSDLVVQVSGSCLAVVSPRVIEVATGEQVSMEELGGAEVHARRTGETDLVATDDAEAVSFVRRWLSYLPASIHEPAPRRDSIPPPGRMPLSAIVPAERQRAYDARKVLVELADGGEFLELKPEFGRSLLTVLARIDGHTVGVLASNPMFQAGALDPDSCDKGTRLLCLCDAFDLPVLILQDSPGFLVGSRVEHARAINKTILFLEALAQMRAPRIVVITRKSYGLSYTSLGGYGTGSDLFVAWPGAEIGFMDPDVAVNVLYGDELAELGAEARHVRVKELAADLEQSNDPLGSASKMYLDEIIHPDETRDVIAQTLRRFVSRRLRRPDERPLRSWPTCW